MNLARLYQWLLVCFRVPNYNITAKKSTTKNNQNIAKDFGILRGENNNENIYTHIHIHIYTVYIYIYCIIGSTINNKVIPLHSVSWVFRPIFRWILQLIYYLKSLTEVTKIGIRTRIGMKSFLRFGEGQYTYKPVTICYGLFYGSNLGIYLPKLNAEKFK